MTLSQPGFCINCGARLEPHHRYCWHCGAARWTASDGPGDADGSSVRPAEPGAGTLPPDMPVPAAPVAQARSDAGPPPAAARLGLLPWFYAAGAVFFLIQATEGLAYLVSPAGRAQLTANLTQQGVPASMQTGVLTAYWSLVIGGSLVAAALHAAAFYGLRRQRRWGWIAAVVVAALWSLVIVGIPVLIRLVNRSVRRSFGVD